MDGPGDPQQSDRPALIRPRVGIDPLRFEHSLEDVYRILGKPDAIFYGAARFEIDALPDRFYVVYRRARFTILVEHGRILSITTMNPRHRLECGLSVGASQAEVMERFGRPARAHQVSPIKRILDFPDDGICFQAHPELNRVVGISVSRESVPPVGREGGRASAERAVPEAATVDGPYRFHVNDPVFEPADGEGGGGLRRSHILLRESEVYREFLSALNSLEFIDGSHGPAHAWRVGALCMAFYSQLAPDGDLALEYFLMGYLHDIGRRDGSRDPTHGEASVEQIKRLGFTLGRDFAEAIAAHPSKKQPETMQEICLFDADRFDLLRLKRRLDQGFFSPYALRDWERIVTFHSMFIKNRHCCYLPAQMPNAVAKEVFLYLHHHLRYLDRPRLYHGSDIHDLEAILPAAHGYPLRGSYVYATKDYFEAVLAVMEKNRTAIPDTISVYEVDPSEVSRILYSFRGIEYVFEGSKPVLKEIRVKVDSSRSPFENYRDLVLAGGA